MPNELDNADASATNQNNDETPSGEHETRTVHRVALKLPPFWVKQPELYFSSIEAQFILAGITVDSTKYHAVIAALNVDVLAHISDIVLSPVSDTKYTELKKRLIAEFKDSEQKRLKALVSEIPLGDERPSHLLRKMRNLAGSSLQEDMLKALWLPRLPVQAQAILSVSNETKLDPLALLADKILEVSAPVAPDCYAVQASGSGSNEIAALKVQISELTERLERMSRPNDRPTRPRDRSSSRKGYNRYRRDSRPNSRTTNSNNNPSPDNQGYCWYHNKFGKNAENCRDPCSFSFSENQ